MRPPQVLIELRPSHLHAGGVGVFPVRDIHRGQRVAEGISEEDFHHLVPWDRLRDYEPETRDKIAAFCVGTPGGFIPPPDFDFSKLSVDWYLNHSCDGNCGFDDRGDFVAIRDIRVAEEITYDYALVESNPNFRMPCTCGSKHCRGIITGNDWKQEQFRLNKLDYMHPHLRRLVPVGASG